MAWNLGGGITPEMYEKLSLRDREALHDALTEWIETVNESQASVTGRSPQQERREL